MVDLPGVGKNFQDHIHAAIVMEAEPWLGLVMPKTPRQWLELAQQGVRYVRTGGGKLASNLGEGGGFLSLGGGSHGAGGARPDVQLHFAPGYAVPPPGYAERGAWAHPVLACILRPKSRGEIRLRRARAEDPPRIDPRFFSEASDREMVVRALERARAIAAAPPLVVRRAS